MELENMMSEVNKKERIHGKPKDIHHRRKGPKAIGQNN